MKLSTLAKLLQGQLSPAAYRAEVAEELRRHIVGLRSPARTAAVESEEDCDLVLSRAELAVLCRYFASGQLSAKELAYTADVLQLSERVEIPDESVADDLALLTDPEINGPMSPSRALAIAGH